MLFEDGSAFMRLVVDTNQVAAIAKTQPTNSLGPSLVMPPLVWAEVLRSSHYGPRRLRALRAYDILFGVDLPTVLDSLADMTEPEIRCLDPVLWTNSAQHQFLYDGFMNPKTRHFEPVWGNRTLARSG
jgi:hypothetical protein